MSHPQRPTSSMNQRFGPYLVGETIGRGTFAKVKIAIHETTKVQVALKIIPCRIMDSDPRSALKIRREIKIMKLLRHPCITRLYDVVKTKHDIVIVMELVSGGELFEYINGSGRLDEPTARHFFQQIAAAVAFCHRHRVTHRDIKPENLLMTHDLQRIKLADFGLSSYTHDGRFFETSCGTPNYASPEVVSGRLYDGPEADAWSCGVVLYAMLSGTLPFDEKNVSDLFRRIQVADFTIPSYFSPAAKDLIGKMLVVNPLERATMEQVMHHPWLRPSFPNYLLSVHYQAVLESMRLAQNSGSVEELLDDEVVRAVAIRCRTDFGQVLAVVGAEEERRPSMTSLVTDGYPHATRRYPAAEYWETFSNVIDVKLWPTPLAIPLAEKALRDEEHDVVVSYAILLQRKQDKLSPTGLTNASFGEDASSLLQFQSFNGYGTLNANSLNHVSGNPSFTANTLRESLAHSSGQGQRSPAVATFFSLLLQTHTDDTSRPCSDNDDAWQRDYNRLAAPFLPLQSNGSTHTILGRTLKVEEFPVELLRARNVNLQSFSKDDKFSSISALGRKGAHDRATDLYAPMESAQQSAMLQPLLKPRESTQNESKSYSYGSSQLLCATNSNYGDPMHAPDDEAERENMPAATVRSSSCRDTSRPKKIIDGADQQGTAPGTLYRVEAVTRFGNDYLRNGVAFIHCTPQKTLDYLYDALREEGLLWRVIYDYYFSCIRYPNIKLQVKMYKVTSEEQVVDVKVSVQSGMAAFDVALSLLERLRNKAIMMERSSKSTDRQANAYDILHGGRA